MLGALGGIAITWFALEMLNFVNRTSMVTAETPRVTTEHRERTRQMNRWNDDKCNCGNNSNMLTADLQTENNNAKNKVTY